MGSIPRDLIARHVEHGETIACVTPARHLIVAGVSNWGAYALIGALAVLRADWRARLLACLDERLDQAILEATVNHGPAVDGVSRARNDRGQSRNGGAPPQIAGDPRSGRGRAWPIANSYSKSYHYDPARSDFVALLSFQRRSELRRKLIFDFCRASCRRRTSEALDRIFRLIFLLSGVSYYKAFIPKTVDLPRPFRWTNTRLHSCTNSMKKGWPNLPSEMASRCAAISGFDPAGEAASPPISLDLPRRTCVPVGGGKDSLVTVEWLRQRGRAAGLVLVG